MNETVMKRVEEHATRVKELGYNYFFVAHQGSWNYDLGYEGSDVDTKALIIPKFEDFCLQRPAISTTHVLENDEHIDLKDFREMLKNFWKQNINFLEVLFSEYVVVNEEYREEYERLIALRERIAHFNQQAAIKCMHGMAMEKFAALEHPYPAQKEVVEKYGYSGKQLHHLCRMRAFMIGYGEGLSFEKCLTFYAPYTKDFLMRCKKQETSLEYAKAYANMAVDELDFLRTKYTRMLPTEVDVEVKKEAEAIMVEVLKKAFKKEVEND